MKDFVRFYEESYLQLEDPEIFELIRQECGRQDEGIELIASENYASPAVLEAVGSILTNKYAEGYPDKRYYGGCEFVDEVEKLAIERCKKLFGCEHINVQPHSGSQANMAVYNAILEDGDAILAMNLSCGGHLTHGSPVNFSGKRYNIIPYGVDKNTERIDFDQILKLAKECKPKLIVCGASAYPRYIMASSFRSIADEVGAYLMFDIAHIAGLVATGLHHNPIPFCDFVTSTTHKTLRGPRGGIIMCKKEFAKKIDSSVFPGIQGGPLMHVIAGKAVCFKEALKPEFRDYQQEVKDNAAILVSELAEHGFRLVTGGTDNHLMLVDLTNWGISGADAQEALEYAGITVNKNTIPFDSKGPTVTSGIRLGTPAVTTRGFKSGEMTEIAGFVAQVIANSTDRTALGKIRKEVKALCRRFPIYAV